MSKRTEQVSSELLSIISQIIERDIEMPGCFVTLTSATVSPDLKITNISITVIPDTREQTALNILKKRAGFIQSQLKSKIRFYTIPKIRFFIDEGDKRRRTVSDILNQIQDELKEDEPC